MVNSTEKNTALSWAIDTSDTSTWLIKEFPEKKDYAEILTNLIVMQEGNFAEQVESQSLLNNLKDTADYVNDIIGIAEAFIGGSNILETVSPIISAATGGKDVLIETIEQTKYYETTTQNYVQTYGFLNVVNQYADNEELHDIAASLLEANDALLQKQVEYLSSATDSIVNYENAGR